MSKNPRRSPFRISFISRDGDIVAPVASEVLTQVRSTPAWDGATICPTQGDFPRAYITWQAEVGFNFHGFETEHSLGHFLVSKKDFSTPSVEVDLGGQALEQWPRELLVPEPIAAEALEYFLESGRLKQYLSWAGTGEFPRESIWQNRAEREAWERGHQAR